MFHELTGNCFLERVEVLSCHEFLHLFLPAKGIPFVFERGGLCRQLQWAEGIDHHRQFVGAHLADRPLVGTGMRPVRDPVWMHREGGWADALARHEVALHVVDDFVGIDVRMVVRRGNRERMVVEEPWDERAHHEARALEGLMYWRRLMHAPGDRFEIANVERKRPEVTVPA